MRLAQKTAIVTGGASGFGEGIVRAFVAEGATVVIADLNLDRAQVLAKELGDAVLAVQTNVTVDADIVNLIEETQQAFGAINIFVNNAGTGHKPQLLEDLSEQEFDHLFQVNAKSVYLTARHVVPLMKANGGGAILNIASTGGVSPRPNLTWYNASKGWMITATKGMAVELAPSQIRVNAINPVAGETPMLKTFMGDDTPAMRAKFLSSIPLGRFSTPADMGAAAVFLCSDEASMITGIAMEVDGGRCI